ncbi:MAG: arginase [Alphaproteobacteria bacterium]|nr:arginase [Alphaproteobacteria bacterium]
MKQITLVGAPVNEGSRRPGCLMGPDAMRTAGLAGALAELGHAVEDWGDAAPQTDRALARHPNNKLYAFDACAAWVETLQETALEACNDNRVPIFLGGDHLMAAGTVPGLAAGAERDGRPLFVLWLDAHTDFHSLETSDSGNLHGTPVAYFTGQAGFDGYFPALKARVRPEHICMLGIRSVDGHERAALSEMAKEKSADAIDVVDMRRIDETGIAQPLRAFLERVEEANGRLHVSFDIDFLDPDIAPAVGTTVPGGATFREAHLIMEMLHDSDLVTSLDVAELNPFLDERGRTATLMVDLVASLFGKSVMDRPTRGC